MQLHKPSVLIIAIAIVGVILTAYTAAVMNPSVKTLPSTGSVTTTQTPVETVNIALYSDAALTQSLTSVDWSSLTPGSSTTKTIYIKNTGTQSVTLSLSTSNWNPTQANGPISLSWDKTGATLAAEASTSAVLTLNIQSSISGITSFTFSIAVTGTPI